MSQQPTIGIYSPGAMGSGLGLAWQRGGARVVTTLAGRSARTQELSRGLEILPDLEAVVAVADVVVSVGPPALAGAFAEAIAQACQATGSHPVVADVNAISPETLAELAATLAGVGCEVLDGSISGGPPTETSATRLYLSGPSADRISQWPATGLVYRVVGDQLGTASAVKMCTAAIYKGFAGLLAQSLRTSRTHGVTAEVLADLQSAFGPQLTGAASLIAAAAAKSDRYPGEMREIARTQSVAGLPASLYLAFAEVYEDMNRTELATLSPEQAAAMTDLDEVLEKLRIV
ncbi:DUF1932 domain-containing protein [Jatrophihabitans sp. DSM 45814]